MLAEKLLSRLHGVRASSKPNSWLAKCPAHEDRSPSLAITEADERLLIKCFAGCGADEIVEAVGLELADLFPPRPPAGYRHAKQRPRFPAAEVLSTIKHELTVVRLALLELTGNGTISIDSHHRLEQTLSRVEGALRAMGYGEGSL